MVCAARCGPSVRRRSSDRRPDCTAGRPSPSTPRRASPPAPAPSALQRSGSRLSFPADWTMAASTLLGCSASRRTLFVARPSALSGRSSSSTAVTPLRCTTSNSTSLGGISMDPPCSLDPRRSGRGPGLTGVDLRQETTQRSVCRVADGVVLFGSSLGEAQRPTRSQRARAVRPRASRSGQHCQTLPFHSVLAPVLRQVTMSLLFLAR